MTGPKKTLTDELRSVLLSHSMDAPEPDETIDWILAQTVEAEPESAGPHWWQWRPSGQAMLAAGVVALLVLAGAGVNELRKNNGNSTGSSSAAGVAEPAAGTARARASAAATSAAAGGAKADLAGPEASASKGRSELPLQGTQTSTPPLNGTGLHCAAIPGGHLVSGSPVTYRVGSATRYAYEYSCVGTNGARSTSEVQTFERVGGTLRYVDTALGSTDGYQVQDLTVAPTGFDIDAIGIAGPNVGSIVTLHVSSAPNRSEVPTPDVQAKACRPSDLTAAVDTGMDSIVNNRAVPATYSLIAVKNKTTMPCALSGYPTLTVAGAAPSGSVVPHTLSGPNGGVKEAQVIPIISLEPGGIAAAVIETPVASSRCSMAPFSVSLPGGGASIATTGLPLCDVTVHPFVYNQSGSDTG